MLTSAARRIIEGKGPRDPLDRPFGSRKRSAVEQALQYAVNLQIDDPAYAGWQHSNQKGTILACGEAASQGTVKINLPFCLI
jgi:hypothetical protein